MLLLSKGRTAYCGPADACLAHFEALGHAVPPHTSVAEFLLDAVNADFTDDAKVDAILDAWAPVEEDRGPAKVDGDAAPPPPAQLAVCLRRQCLLIRRDPILLVVRAVALFAGNLYFSIVYIQARRRHQDQVQNRMMAALWLLVYPTEASVRAAFDRRSRPNFETLELGQIDSAHSWTRASLSSSSPRRARKSLSKRFNAHIEVGLKL